MFLCRNIAAATRVGYEFYHINLGTVMLDRSSFIALYFESYSVITVVYQCVGIMDYFFSTSVSGVSVATLVYSLI